MFGTGIIGRRTYSWPEYYHHEYDRYGTRRSALYYFPFKDEQTPLRLSWKEEAKRPWLKPKPKAKEMSSNLYKLLARSN